MSPCSSLIAATKLPSFVISLLKLLSVPIAVVFVDTAVVSIPSNLVWSASVNTFELVAASTNVLISAAVWSAVALS